VLSVRLFTFSISLMLIVVMLSACRSDEPGSPETRVVYVDRPIEVLREVVVEIEVPVEVPVEVIREVEKTVIVEIPVVKEVLVELEDWKDLEELQAFLKSDSTDSRIVLTADEYGVVRLVDQCEDAAIQLMDNAMAVGKRLSFVPLHPSEYLKWYGSYPGAGRYHAICGALVGENEFYYIEPNEDRVWLAQYLD